MTGVSSGDTLGRRKRGQGGIAAVGSPRPQPCTARRASTVRVLHGHVLKMLARLPEASIDCCVTSPPYWGLRDYGLPPQVWDAGEGCAHSWSEAGFCNLCKAWRGQLGLEPDLDLYLRHVVEVFRQVRRVLKPTGTLWLNLGDAYNSATSAPRRPSAGSVSYWRSAGAMGDRRLRVPGLKPKDLVGLPWRVALALQADGWYLRSDVVWAKPNPLPEGVTDRPVRSHEYVFLLTKSERYFYDAEAVRESTPVRAGHPRGAELVGHKQRSVWTIPTRGYRGAHFATFPELLVERCIRAGSSEFGCCSSCGAPWRRQVRASYLPTGGRTTNGPRSCERRHESPGFPTRLRRVVRSATWVPGCGCGEPPKPALVLDPFAGSGTTLAVAGLHGRDSIGVELSRAYLVLIESRLRHQRTLSAS